MYPGVPINWGPNLRSLQDIGVVVPAAVTEAVAAKTALIEATYPGETVKRLREITVTAETAEQAIEQTALRLATERELSNASGVVQGVAEQRALRAMQKHAQDLSKQLAEIVRDSGHLEAIADAAGETVTGSQIDYNGSPAGYTSDPQEAINYVDAHDGQTLYDTLTLKLPQPTTMADRIRMQTLSLATTALSQGVSFWQAGTENLRSKSFDSNSYNSGDWFNILDPSLQTNGFARGLPPAASNQAMWPYEKPLLADPALNPTPADIQSALAQSETLLSLRQSSPLFHLGTAQAIEQKLSFPNSGPDSTPGVITIRIDDTVGPNIDPALKGIVVVFNATPSTTTQTVSAAARSNYALSPIQQHGSDPVVRASTYDPSTGTFTVPGRTVAVFINR